MKKIAFFPLTPLGDCIAQMAQLCEIHRLYAPCHITVFAIPLIVELYRNYKYCDEAVELEGKIRGPVNFREIPQTEFDVVFNHGYEPSWSNMLRQMKYKEAYGMEEMYRPEKECRELFTKYVTLDHWKNVTLKKYRFVAEQMSESSGWSSLIIQAPCPALMKPVTPAPKSKPCPPQDMYCCSPERQA